MINVCKEAAIFGLDQTIWAKSKGISLTTYDFDTPQEDGSTKKVECNETKCLITMLKDGVRNGGQQCGVRVNNTKMMVVRMSEEDKVKFAVMSMKGGNVVAAMTNKAVLVGLIDKELPQGGTSKL